MEKIEHQQQPHQRIIECSTPREASFAPLRADSQNGQNERPRAIEAARAATAAAARPGEAMGQS